jgi:hypothetical protein
LWYKTLDTRVPPGRRRLSLAAGAADDLSLLELENTLNFPAEEMVAIALQSEDRRASVGGSPPPPVRQECLTCLDDDDMRLSSPRADKARTGESESVNGADVQCGRHHSRKWR